MIRKFITKGTALNHRRFSSATPHPSNYPGNDLFSFFSSYLDIRAAMRGGGLSWAHNLYTSLCLEVIKSRVDSEYTISELLEGTPIVLNHVTSLINEHKYQDIAGLMVRGPGRDATALENAMQTYGLASATNPLLEVHVNGPAMLEALQFDFVGWKDKRLRNLPSQEDQEEEDNQEESIVWTMNSEASENVRQLQHDIGMQGLGEHMLTSSDLKVMCSVYVPAQIRLYTTQEVEQDSDQQELAKTVEKDGLHLHNTSDGCRIVMQSNVGSDNALDWKLLHVDFGQLGEDDHKDSMVTTRVEGSVLRF